MKEVIYKCPLCGQEYEEHELPIICDYVDGRLSQEYRDLTCACGYELEETTECSVCGELMCISEIWEDDMCEECFKLYGEKEE